jgi:hypothetical protein
VSPAALSVTLLMWSAGCIEVYTSAKNAAARYEKAHYAAHPCPAEGRTTTKPPPTHTQS